VRHGIDRRWRFSILSRLCGSLSSCFGFASLPFQSVAIRAGQRVGRFFRARQRRPAARSLVRQPRPARIFAIASTCAVLQACGDDEHSVFAPARTSAFYMRKTVSRGMLQCMRRTIDPELAIGFSFAGFRSLPKIVVTETLSVVCLGFPTPNIGLLSSPIKSLLQAVRLPPSVFPPLR